MKVLKEFLFGRVADPVCTIKTGYHTVHAYPHPTTYGDWVEEFRVGILFDKKAIEMSSPSTTEEKQFQRDVLRNLVKPKKTLIDYV